MWVSRLDNSVSQDMSSTSLVTNRLFFCQLGIQSSFGLRGSMSFGIGKSYVDTSIRMSVMKSWIWNAPKVEIPPDASCWLKLLPSSGLWVGKRCYHESWARGVLVFMLVVFRLGSVNITEVYLFKTLWIFPWGLGSLLMMTWIFQGASFSIWQRHWYAWRK